LAWIPILHLEVEPVTLALGVRVNFKEQAVTVDILEVDAV
jgi:hypothetical protein